MDDVDKILAQWNQERPDLNVTPMGLVGRISRISSRLNREMEKTFAAHRLNYASFDVLATLRRSGPPYGLSPGDLLATMMVTSGTMTNRIDQLVKAGMVERKNNPEDGRSVIIALTDKGFAIVDETVTAHVETITKVTSGLPKEKSELLNGLLSELMQTLEEK